jgi:hypothetical protein
MSLHLFAGMRVRDFEAARPWYERLLGEPTFFAHATEAVWTLAARGLEPDERLTYSNGVRKALYRDPDGNELGFGGAPLETG